MNNMTPKTLVEPSETQASLERLRNELWEIQKNAMPRHPHREMLLKVNSCLYDRYPVLVERPVLNARDKLIELYSTLNNNGDPDQLYTSGEMVEMLHECIYEDEDYPY